MATTSDSHANHAAHASAAETEPQTPMWLPAVGVFLFLVAGVYGVTTRTPEPGELEAAASASAAAAKPAAAATAPRVALTNRPPTVPPPNAASGTPSGRVPQGAGPILKRVVP